MSQLIELLGRGLDRTVSEILSPHYWNTGLSDPEELAEVVRAEPDSADVRRQMGLACLRASRVDQAIKHLTEACRLTAGDFSSRLALASALCDAGEDESSLNQLRLVDQEHPNEPAVLFSMGLLLEKLDRADEAIPCYERCLEVDGRHLSARQRLAAAALFRKRLDIAIEQYEQIVQDDPGDVFSRAALAQLCYQNEDYDAAVRHYEDAIAMEPENWALVDDQVEALIADGQTRDAIERLEELLGLQGDFPDIHCRLADLYSQLGEDCQAMWHYNKALDIQPNYLEAQVKLGTHHLIHGRWSQASETFAAAVELNDHLLSAYVGLGISQAALGDNIAAMSSLDLAAAVDPNSTLLVREMARLQLKSELEIRVHQGDAETAAAERMLEGDDLLRLQLHCHADQIDLEPGYADLHYRFGVLLRAEGRLEAAVEQFRKAVEINPSYTRAWIKLGVSLEDLNQKEDARRAFTKAIEIEPHYLDLHYRLGLMHTDGRRFEETVRQMELEQTGAENDPRFRAGLDLALQNLGLKDRAAAAWRSLRRTFRLGLQTTRDK